MARSASDEQVRDRSERESVGEAVGEGEASRAIASAIETAMAVAEAVAMAESKFAKEPSRGNIGTAAWAAASGGRERWKSEKQVRSEFDVPAAWSKARLDGAGRHAEP